MKLNFFGYNRNLGRHKRRRKQALNIFWSLFLKKTATTSAKWWDVIEIEINPNITSYFLRLPPLKNDVADEAMTERLKQQQQQHFVYFDRPSVSSRCIITV